MADYLNGFILNLINTSVNGVLIFIVVLLICMRRGRMSSQVKSRILFLSFTSLFLVFLFMPMIKNLDFVSDQEAFSVINMNEYRQQEFVSRSDEVLDSMSQKEISHTESKRPDAPAADILAGFLENWQKGLFLLWMPGFLYCVIQLAAGFYGVNRIKANAVERRFPAYEMVAEQLKLKKRPRVMVNECDFTPFTAGFFHPVIILPKDAINWSQERLEVVFMHEMIHIKKADFLKNLFIRMVCAIFWFNPFVWKTFKRYHFEQESACDNQVVSNGIKPYVYAKELLEVAKGCHTIRFASSLTGPQTTSTEKRILGILSNERTIVFSRKQYVLTAFTIIFSLLFSAFTFTFVKAENLMPESDVPTFWPVYAEEYYISSGFGDRIITETGVNKDINRGINISWKGSLLKAYATADGTVASVAKDSFGRFCILIDHGNGMSTYYKSLCYSYVEEGETVHQKDTIGASTGFSKCNILSETIGNVDFHLEIRKGNKVIDPMLLIKKAEEAE